MYDVKQKSEQIAMCYWAKEWLEVIFIQRMV